MKKVISFLLDADSLIGRLVCGTLYLLVYDFMYSNYIYALFHYMGVEYIKMNEIKYLSWLFISLVPLIFYQGMKDLTTFFTIFAYLFIYIPFIHAVFVIWGVDMEIVYGYALILCFFFSLYFIVGTRGSIFKNMEVRPSLSLRSIEVITLLVTVIFIVFKASSMHLVNFFTDVQRLYQLRAENSEASQSIGFVTYLQGWLFGAFYPFLLVCYLKQKKKFKSLLILIGYFTLFMADMQKLTFFMPFVLIGLYFFLNLKYNLVSKRTHSFLILVIIVTSIIFYNLQDNEILFMIGSIILLRTVCVSGWLTQMYLHFFIDKPFTHYSHINIVNAITNEYPFDVPLGQAVAYNTQNANANFILTDGLAAWGVGGIIFISIFFLLLLHFIKAITYRYEKTDLFVICTPSLSYMLNTSIFTTLLSCGFAFLLIILTSSHTSLSDD
jgi:hypothetical protein